MPRSSRKTEIAQSDSQSVKVPVRLHRRESRQVESSKVAVAKRNILNLLAAHQTCNVSDLLDFAQTDRYQADAAIRELLLAGEIKRISKFPCLYCLPGKA